MKNLAFAGETNKNKEIEVLMRKLAAVSLGCEKNLIDTEVMLGLLEKADCVTVSDPAEADIILVNTCGFIESAKQESINTILEMARYKKSGRCRMLVVSGCLAQKYAADLLADLPEIDVLLGTGEIDRIAELINQAWRNDGAPDLSQRLRSPAASHFVYTGDMPRLVTTPWYLTYLKIAEGCNNNCSYCVIPEIRGPYRSREIGDIVAEAQKYVAQGSKELLVIAQDTTFFGRDRCSKPQLADLLDELAALEGDFWLRVLYCYPNNFDQRLIDCFRSNKKLCKYIDLPLQHINDAILKDMHRHVTSQQIKELIKNLREQIPGLVLRTTFIVGYPGETEEQFAELCAFVAETRFDRLGVFQYSQEPNTPAGERPDQIPAEVKQQRYDQLMQLQLAISRQNNKRLLGRRLAVLVEGISELDGKKYYFGRSRRDAPDIDGVIYFRSRKKHWNAGDVAEVLISGALEYDLMGEVLR